MVGGSVSFRPFKLFLRGSYQVGRSVSNASSVIGGAFVVSVFPGAFDAGTPFQCAIRFRAISAYPGSFSIPM